jgi:hypothetical protein
MNALTLTSQQEAPSQKAPTHPDPIPLRWSNVLYLHLAGKSHEEISISTGYTVNSIYRILAHPNVNYVRQQLLEATQKEFEALFSKVVKVIRTGLEDPDSKVRAIYTNQWLRSHGKISEKGEGTTINLTAEDIVMNLLNNPGGDAIVKQGG